ncbi:MAG: aldo/keto reductase, partial [Thermoplasmata archaeon]
MSFPTKASIASRVRLNQGVEIPWLGLGVFQSEPGPVTRDAVRYALETGYRAVDTAAMYRNEADVGEAVRQSGVPRDEVFVTTKLWHTEHGFESALRAGRASAERLGLGPIDLYLIHWPRANSPQDRIDSWRAFTQLQREGVCRAIGVSNYTVRHLEELRAHSDVVPAVDQVEFHPFVYDPKLLEYC